MALNLVLSIPALASVIGGFWLFALALSEALKEPSTRLADIAADIGIHLLFACMIWSGAHYLILIWT